MISAQCVEKSLGSCRRDSGKLVLKDRYQKEFRVRKDCENCMNLIYNSAPLVLAGCEDKISRLNIAGIRLMFTDEGAKETEEVLRAYIRSFFYGQETGYTFRDFTRGHFNRGVE